MNDLRVCRRLSGVAVQPRDSLAVSEINWRLDPVSDRSSVFRNNTRMCVQWRAGSGQHASRSPNIFANRRGRSGGLSQPIRPPRENYLDERVFSNIFVLVSPP